MHTLDKIRLVETGAELYDLEKGPREFVNLADLPGNEEILRQLDDLLWQWMESVSDPLLKGPVVSPAYLETMGHYQRWISGRVRAIP